jgi:hypothetical protein
MVTTDSRALIPAQGVNASIVTTPKGERVVSLGYHGAAYASLRGWEWAAGSHTVIADPEGNRAALRRQSPAAHALSMSLAFATLAASP